jgi:hypothetical protein
MATTAAFRTLDDAGKLADNYVNPDYLEDRREKKYFLTTKVTRKTKSKGRAIWQSKNKRNLIFS